MSVGTHPAGLEVSMLDDFREQAGDASLFDDVNDPEYEEYEEFEAYEDEEDDDDHVGDGDTAPTRVARKPRPTIQVPTFGMTAFQRLVLSFLLLMASLVLSFGILVAAEKIVF
jgi:hypothetical protein